MGYKPIKKIYDMSFASYPGLEVKCTATSLGKLMDLAKLNIKLNEIDEEKKMQVFHTFAANIVSWNIEHPAWDNVDAQLVCPRCGLDEGEDLPPTSESMLCLDLDFIMDIIFGWMGATSSVSGPKGMSLSNGERPQEDLMNQLGSLQSLLK